MSERFLDSSRISTTLVRSAQRALAETLTRLELEGGTAAVENYLQNRILTLEEAATPEELLERFLAVISLLALHERGAIVLPGPKIGRLAELADAILKTLGIQPGTSRLTFLHGDLRQVLSQIRRREGRAFESAWEAQIAQIVGRSGSRQAQGYHALATATRALRLGFGALAIEGFAIAEAQLAGRPEWERARLGRIQALRLTGQAPAARELARSSEGIQSEAGRLDLAWEELCLATQLEQEIGPLVSAVGRGRPHRQSSYMLEATLWVKAISSRQWLTKTPKVESIRRLFGDTLKRPHPNSYLYEAALQFDRCYDGEIPLLLRIEGLGQVLAQASRLLTIDKELLLWACATRWCLRHHQTGLTALAQERYRALCLSLSGGASSDVLGLGLDFKDKAWERFDEKSREVASRETLDKLHQSTWDRAAVLTRFGVAVAGSRLKSKIKRVGADPTRAAEILAAEHEEVAAHILKSLGALKGPLTKVGQVWSFIIPHLPEPIRNALNSLRDDTPPLSGPIIRVMVEAELGRPVTELFADWDDEPFAAASISQIHRVRLKDGRDAVCKVQYPGIEQAIHSDLRIMRLLSPYFKRLFPRANVQEILAITERHLMEECDFAREARIQTLCRNAFRDDPDIVVPEIFPKLSTGKVLTMEYLDGIRFDEFLEQATQSERNTVGQIIYRFAWGGVFRQGVFNADPHPGNYLLLPDGRVGFLDFGYAETYPLERRLYWRECLLALMDEDRERFRELFSKSGFLAAFEGFDWDAAWLIAMKATTALRHKGPFRFTPGFVQENIDGIALSHANRQVIQLPLVDARLVRFTWCMQAVLSQLGAEADWGRIFREIIADPSEFAQSA